MPELSWEFWLAFQFNFALCPYLLLPHLVTPNVHPSLPSLTQHLFLENPSCDKASLDGKLLSKRNLVEMDSPNTLHRKLPEYLWSPQNPLGKNLREEIRECWLCLRAELCYSSKLKIPAAAAVAAKWLQLSPTLCDPIDGSPPGSSVPGILQARTLEWVAISFSNAWKWKWSCLVMSDS